ncbi:MAG: DUF5675 family protein [Rubrivivax sp.]|nr:DUF5675 family protein [Rubrivivax sp.]
MQLKVVRQTFTENSTIGQLYVDGQFECYTLEDVVRPEKIYGETAIPAGRYAVTINVSARFGKRLPLLLNVPEYTGVRIHPGNTKADTLGCILVGQTKSADSIGASRAAFAALMPKLETAAKRGAIEIEIVDEPVAKTRGRRRAAPPALPAVTKKVAAKKVAAKKAAVPAEKAVVKKAATPAKKVAAKKMPAVQPKGSALRRR